MTDKWLLLFTDLWLWWAHRTCVAYFTWMFLNFSRSFLSLEGCVRFHHGIKLETKVTVMKACILTFLLYASETWTLYKHQLQTLECFHQRCLRQIPLYWMAITYPWYRAIRESWATKHWIYGSEELSLFKWMTVACQSICFYDEMWEGERNALEPKKKI